MSIPKLKVYRLDDGYSDSKNTDIQFKSGDELLPVSVKDLYLGDVEEMVGVRERGDARLVVEGGWNTMALQIDSTQQIKQTAGVPCDGWVLGKGNFRVFAKRVPKNDTSSSGSVSGNPYVDSSGNGIHGWAEVGREMWDCVVSQVKVYRCLADPGAELANVWVNNVFYETYTVGGSSPVVVEYESGQFQSLASVTAKDVYQRNTIRFRMGDLFTQSSRFFTNGYSQYKPVFSGVAGAEFDPGDPDNFVDKIVIQYKKYCEYGESSTVQLVSDGYSEESENPANRYFINPSNIVAQDSGYGVPFGDIYNGNRNGRCLRYKISDGDATRMAPSIPDGALMDHTRIQYYEGNYDYKRRVFPLRYLSAVPVQDGSGQVSCVFNSTRDWYADGLMRPVLMRRILVDAGTSSERYIFKELVENTQVNKITNDTGDYIQYSVSYIPDYYRIAGGGYAYPRESDSYDKIYMFYNEIDESCGSIMDFNYDYGAMATAGDDDFGYSNTGVLASGAWKDNAGSLEWQGNALAPVIFAYDNGNIAFKRTEKMAAEEGFGYDSSAHMLMSSVGSAKSFTLSDAGAVAGMGFRVYIDGSLAYDSRLGTPSVSDRYDVEASGTTWTIAVKDGMTGVDLPHDALLVYYQSRTMGTAFSDGGEWCHGYRVPCYEKVKQGRLFVSSYPNWLKGHLNNDLDVFVGNKAYSGMSAENNAEVDQICPCYVKDGWNALYPEGAVMFNEEQTEFDWLDIFNFGAASGISIQAADYQDENIGNLFPNWYGGNNLSNYRLYYRKVAYNVAHYDGVYSVVRGMMSNVSVQGNKHSYRMIEDDDFEDAFGRRWVTRSGTGLRSFYESEQMQIPEAVSSQEGNMHEAATVVRTDGDNALQDGLLIDGSSVCFIRTNIRSDRATVMRYRPGNGANEAIICLNENLSDQYLISSPLDSEVGLKDNDVRVHVKVDGNVFCVGEEATPPAVSPQAVDDLIAGNVPVNWYEIPPLEPIMPGTAMESIQSNEVDIGPGLPAAEPVSPAVVRYKCSGLRTYDIYFEVFSYRYADTEAYRGRNTKVDSVEFMVYRMKKGIIE